MQYEYTELDNLHKAIECLSKGIDPTSGVIFSKDTILNSKIIQSYLAEAAKLLKLFSVNIDLISPQKTNKTKNVFFLCQEELNSIPLFDSPISVSKFTFHINSMTKKESMRKLKATQITSWLTENGYLEILVNESQNEYKIANKAGNEIGITSEIKQNKRGDTYALNLYNRKAQSFVKENLNKISIGIK